MVESHRYESDKYICEHCSKGFAWRPNLLRHKMLHGEFRRFPCENCDKVFTDPRNLQRHIRTSHVGARCHACPECGKTFATSSGLKQHTHIHSSVKPFRCEVCFKSYTQFSNLCRHKRMHANCRMQIKCHKCGQAFSTVTSLSKHRRFCDSTPSPFLPGGGSGGGNNGQSKMTSPVGSSMLDLSSSELMAAAANGTGPFGHHHNHHHPHLPKFGGPTSFLQPPFTSHLHSLFGGVGHGTAGGAAGGFPFLQGHPHPMMFPTMLQRMAMSHLNSGKSLLSAARPPPPLVESMTERSKAAFLPPPPSTCKPPLPTLGSDLHSGLHSNNNSNSSGIFEPSRLVGLAAESRKLENIKMNISDFKSIEEFRQRLMMNGQRAEVQEEETGSPVCRVENIIRQRDIKQETEEEPEKKEELQPKEEEKEPDTEEEDEEEEEEGEEEDDSLIDRQERSHHPHLHHQGFDVNRNKSDGEPPQKVIKTKESPLDLSTVGRHAEGEDSMSDMDIEDPPPLCSIIDKKIDPKEPVERLSSSSKQMASEVTNDETEDEPRGFKPVGSASKSVIPVTEVSLFPKTTTNTSSSSSSSSAVAGRSTSPEGRLLAQSPPSFGAGRSLFSGPEGSTLPFPRPVNPFLLSAMYRMQQQQQQQAQAQQQQQQSTFPSFHPHQQQQHPHHHHHHTLSSSSPLAPIAPRPLAFSPPFMSSHLTAGSPFLPGSLPLLGRLGCYQDILAAGGGAPLHSSKSKDRYACKFCGKVFPRSANLTRHLRTHTGEQPYKCKYCERSFSISSNLQRHVRNIHNKEKPFRCPLCERCFGQQTNLDRHLKKHETCSDPSEIVDSPESIRIEDDLGYFDEIRSFMGKVVDKSNCSLDASENEVDVEEDDDIIADMD